jgi:hypothetical protein
MDKWINVTALWQIVVVGLLAGAGLPAVFAVGVRVLSPAPASTGPVSGPAGSASVGSVGSVTAARKPAAVVAAAVCFALVLAGIAYGLYMIVSSS